MNKIFRKILTTLGVIALVFSSANLSIAASETEGSNSSEMVVSEFREMTDYTEISSGVSTAAAPEIAAAKQGWVQISGKWYYVDAKGNLVFDWLKLNNKWYFITLDGMLEDGFYKIEGKVYWFAPSGEVKTGWYSEVENGRTWWYYYTANGQSISKWEKINGNWFYLTSKGSMAFGWTDINGKSYYFKDNGVMVTGWQYIKNGWKGSSGSLVDGWSYFDSNGVAKVGWLQYNNNWYYFTNASYMVHSGYIIIDGKKQNFATNGVWLGQI